MSGSERVPEARPRRQQKPRGAEDQRYLRITYGHMIYVIPIITSLRKFVSLINPFVRVTLNFSEYISLLICSLLCGFEKCTYQKRERKRNSCA